MACLEGVKITMRQSEKINVAILPKIFLKEWPQTKEAGPDVTMKRLRGHAWKFFKHHAYIVIKFKHKNIFCLKYTIYQYLNHSMASPPL